MRYLSVCSGIEAASVAWHPPAVPDVLRNLINLMLKVDKLPKVSRGIP